MHMTCRPSRDFVDAEFISSLVAVGITCLDENHPANSFGVLGALLKNQKYKHTSHLHPFILLRPKRKNMASIWTEVSIIYTDPSNDLMKTTTYARLWSSLQTWSTYHQSILAHCSRKLPYAKKSDTSDNKHVLMRSIETSAQISLTYTLILTEKQCGELSNLKLRYPQIDTLASGMPSDEACLGQNSAIRWLMSLRSKESIRNTRAQRYTLDFSVWAMTRKICRIFCRPKDFMSDIANDLLRKFEPGRELLFKHTLWRRACWRIVCLFVGWSCPCRQAAKKHASQTTSGMTFVHCTPGKRSQHPVVHDLDTVLYGPELALISRARI